MARAGDQVAGALLPVGMVAAAPGLLGAGLALHPARRAPGAQLTHVVRAEPLVFELPYNQGQRAQRCGAQEPPALHTRPNTVVVAPPRPPRALRPPGGWRVHARSACGGLTRRNARRTGQAIDLDRLCFAVTNNRAQHTRRHEVTDPLRRHPGGYRLEVGASCGAAASCAPNRRAPAAASAAASTPDHTTPPKSCATLRALRPHGMHGMQAPSKGSTGPAALRPRDAAQATPLLRRPRPWACNALRSNACHTA